MSDGGGNDERQGHRPGESVNAGQHYRRIPTFPLGQGNEALNRADTDRKCRDRSLSVARSLDRNHWIRE